MSTPTRQRIGIMGLGIMGGAMARALLADGHEVVGHDIDARRMRELQKAGGRALPTVAAVARSADALITALPSAAACRQVRGWVATFTFEAPRVGAFGSGTKLKLAANHLVGIFNVACAEMVAFCRHMGLDPSVALRHMGNSPYIGTGLMRLRMPMMLDRKYQPASMKVGIWQKDMQIIADMARSVDCPTPLLNASAGVYSAAMAMGLSDHDTAATAEVWAAMPKRPVAGRRSRGARS
jgi:3-hydroxyisobutyrate dehydrogenase-like beta-hydroxyacid dehydrogenase